MAGKTTEQFLNEFEKFLDNKTMGTSNWLSLVWKLGHNACNRLRTQANRIRDLEDTLKFSAKRFDHLGTSHVEIDVVLENK